MAEAFGHLSRRGLARALMACAMAPVAAAIPAQAQRGRHDTPIHIAVKAHPIVAFRPRVPDQRRFGTLEFIGGLELTSSCWDFGGLSALCMQADGARFISLTDRGRWFTGRIVYDQGRPAAIADAEMAPMLGADGRSLAAIGWYDTESLAQRDGDLYVGIERVNRIVRFDFAKFGLLSRAETVPVPTGVATLPDNLGLEALAFAPSGSPLSGTLIAFSERGLDAAGNLKAFLIGGAAPAEFSVKRSDNFDISDCAVLPSGDVMLLERRFSWFGGIAIRLRRITIADVTPGALVDGPVVLFADMGYQIDNMEGLSAHLAEDGRTILTMVSDDNFSPLQRTIVLQFRLSEGE